MFLCPKGVGKQQDWHDLNRPLCSETHVKLPIKDKRDAKLPGTLRFLIIFHLLARSRDAEEKALVMEK